MNYRIDEVYKTLEKIIRDAGVEITYQNVHDDCIDGEIWARSDIESRIIMMPEDGDAFPDIETACRILGHEMWHIMTELESFDGMPSIREVNERTCDYIGALLYRLADMTQEHEIEEAWEKAKR